ncbi:MAG: ketol-acid reductoisomerase [Planctomycetota bacterium]
MPLPVYYDSDAQPKCIADKTLAVLGYGSQGRAHAMNLRDSGLRVIVAQRPGGANHQRALDDGFDPVSLEEAATQADILIFTLPDESMGDLHRASIQPQLRAGQTLGFVHGFNIRFGRIVAPHNVDVIMVAPKGPGSLVRNAYQRGGGLTCIIAVHQDASGHARDTAIAWGAAIGGGKGGMIESTFAMECEADLFGEQTVLCGGVIELMKSAYDVLIEAGFPPEVAYFECIHEVKQIVDLQYASGLKGMLDRISNTAAYGGLTRGPRLVTEETRREMRAILAEIRSGRFAQEWLAECATGKPRLNELTNNELNHASEAAGRQVRDAAKNAVPTERSKP